MKFWLVGVRRNFYSNENTQQPHLFVLFTIVANEFSIKTYNTENSIYNICVHRIETIDWRSYAGFKSDLRILLRIIGDYLQNFWKMSL